MSMAIIAQLESNKISAKPFNALLKRISSFDVMLISKLLMISNQISLLLNQILLPLLAVIYAEVCNTIFCLI
jgi:hypothetical protein